MGWINHVRIALLLCMSVSNIALLKSLNYTKMDLSHVILINTHTHVQQVKLHIETPQQSNIQNIVLAPHTPTTRRVSGKIVDITYTNDTPIEPQSIVTDTKAHSVHIFIGPPRTTDAPRNWFVPPYTDFRSALGPYYQICNASTRGKYTTATAPYPAQLLLSCLEKLYEIYHPTRITPAQKPKIPRIIHQIWLGSALPKRFHSWQESWLAKHPHWQYILWTDQKEPQRPDLAHKYSRYQQRSISSLMPLTNQIMYTQAPNYGAKSDILRLEILKKYGGLYADVDVRCHEPFDYLHHCYRFFAGIEPLDFLWLSLNNGLIGATQNHPIVTAYIEAITRKEKAPVSWRMTHFVTGPILFTTIFWQVMQAQNLPDSIAFPARYFSPIDRFNHSHPWHETYAEQYFTHSWAT